MNADDLDSAIAAASVNPWYARGCAVGRMIADLPPGEYRNRLIGHLNAPTERVGHAAIITAVESTIGIRLRSDSVLRHRRRACACPDEVYA